MQIKDVNFATLLAASGHDMKNVLGATVEKLDWLHANIKGLTEEQDNEFKKASELLAMVNNELMQLLSLYKFEKKQYSTNIQELYLNDFFELQISYLEPLAKARKLTIEYECEDDLLWPFDEVMLSSAIRNAIMNAMKFAKSKILIIAIAKEKNGLTITVNDDGDGYPKNMLGMVKDNTSTVDFGSASTGLGLHFAEQVAILHSKKDKTGYVELTNGGKLKGACFNIFLPK